MQDQKITDPTTLLNYNSLQNIEFTEGNRNTKFYVNLELKQSY